MYKVAVDWSHERGESDLAIFDGEEFIDNLEDLEGEFEVYTENMPDDKIEEWSEAAEQIYSCGTKHVNRKREEKDIEKTDKNDAKLIYELSEEHPEVGDIFYETHRTPKLLALYRNYENHKQVVKQTKQRDKAYSYIDLSDDIAEAEKLEGRMSRKIVKELEGYPIWTEWLEGVRGVGPRVAGDLIGTLHKKRIEQFSSPGSLWHYCGMHAVETENDGHVAPTLTNANKYGFNVDWNSQLKVKVAEFLPTSFVRGGSEYKRLIDAEKSRQRDLYPDLTDKHTQRRAWRRASKEFLKHLWYIWRKLEGLDVSGDGVFIMEPPHCPVSYDNVDVIGIDKHYE